MRRRLIFLLWMSLPKKWLRNVVRCIAVTLMALILSACSLTDIALTVVNAPVRFEKTQKKLNLTYDNHNNKLDLYYPEVINAPPPVIVFLYGGSWQSGSKDQYKFVAKAFTQRGYAVAVPDYRKYPDVKFPAFVEDSANAIRWLQDNSDTLNIRGDSLFVLGHSAGAHIGGLLACDRTYKTNITAFAGLAGPYNFTPQEPIYKSIFGDVEDYSFMHVTTYIDGKQSPMFLAHGDKDTVVSIKNMTTLREKILEKSGIVETKTYEGLNHYSIIGALSWLYNSTSVADDIDSFFQKYVKQEELN